MNTLIKSSPVARDIVFILPDITSANMEHVIEILEHGAAQISVEDRRTYFDIVEEAQEIGIHIDNVSIFKKRFEIAKEEATDIGQTPLIDEISRSHSDSLHNLKEAYELDFQDGDLDTK